MWIILTKFTTDLTADFTWSFTPDFTMDFTNSMADFTKNNSAKIRAPCLAKQFLVKFPNEEIQIATNDQQPLKKYDLFTKCSLFLPRLRGWKKCIRFISLTKFQTGVNFSHWMITQVHAIKFKDYDYYNTAKVEHCSVIGTSTTDHA